MLLKETLGTAFIFFKKLLSALPIFFTIIFINSTLDRQADEQRD